MSARRARPSKVNDFAARAANSPRVPFSNIGRASISPKSCELYNILYVAGLKVFFGRRECLCKRGANITRFLFQTEPRDVQRYTEVDYGAHQQPKTHLTKYYSRRAGQIERKYGLQTPMRPGATFFYFVSKIHRSGRVVLVLG